MKPSPAEPNPFPGLRTFYTEERHLFFGRAVRTLVVLRRLGQTLFLVAVGPSGCGKSSLVRAGLIPELQGGTMARAGSHWDVTVLRPGVDPLASLAAALSEMLYESCDS